VRGLAWAAALAIIVLAVLMAVPPVRAQILEFIQIGVIRIFQVEPTPTTTPTAPQSAAVLPGVAITPSPALTQRPTSTPLHSLLNLAGETTLGEAQRQASFPLEVPTYPADLGPPDLVFVQDLDGEVVILVWLDPADPNRVQLSLHFYSGEGNITGEKIEPVLVQETEVNGNPAIWAAGPYVLKLRTGSMEVMRLIEGRVLIWEVGEITYRLETDLELQEALKIAESLEPIPEPQP
jgi:hypothetical protein